MTSCRSLTSSPWWRAVALVGLAVLAGCTSPVNRAPVEQRPSVGARPPAAPTGLPPGMRSPEGETAAKPLPGAENAGKPGYYTVKPGDTLLRISLDHGQGWRDLVRWNSLENPNLIEVGQVLRVLPPGQEATVAVAGVPAGRVETRPLDGRPAAAASEPKAPEARPPAAAAPAAPPAPAAAASAAEPAREGEDLAWSWPSSGALLAPYEEGRSKGLLLGGKAGDPVLAAADGRVVYVGSGLRGYGNLIIVKHINNYITAYAHNQSILVAVDQAVRRGQKIAEMGSSDAERVQLHFEVRRQGKPIDPGRVLPAR